MDVIAFLDTLTTGYPLLDVVIIIGVWALVIYASIYFIGVVAALIGVVVFCVFFVVLVALPKAGWDIASAYLSNAPQPFRAILYIPLVIIYAPFWVLSIFIPRPVERTEEEKRALRESNAVTVPRKKKSGFRSVTGTHTSDAMIFGENATNARRIRNLLD